ncbi:MAG TPA: ABC transporter ATP-binding protein [Stellaceae bacterium]|nr:ABC transporter ATP-binding protein [Stellaceae bacterium]
MGRPALSLAGIEKSHGTASVIRGLDLDISQGEFFVLLGPSGCGKTTLLRLVAGLVEPDAGHILLDGTEITRTPAEARNISMVFQDYALYPHMTVRNNLAFGLKRHRVPRGEISQRIERVAGMLGIEQLLDRKPHQLSGGQQQRVALGRAIVRKPLMFLMDEPLSNLDAQIRATTRAELKELQRRLGVTTLYVTHDQVEAMTLADRLAIMNRGRIEQIGRPMAVYRAPATLFVAQFLSNPRLNLLDGEVVFGPSGSTTVRTPVAEFSIGGLPGITGLVQVGIRPESLRLASIPTASSVPLEIVLVEPLGTEVLVHARGPCGELVARSPAENPFTEGETAWVEATATRFDLFDSAGVRISENGSTANPIASSSGRCATVGVNVSSPPRTT